MSATSDRAAIERAHHGWWAANRGLDIEGMTRDLAEDFLMWNLNGHPYFDREELKRLVYHYRAHLVPTEPPELWDIQVTTGADLAYVTAEGVLPITVMSDNGAGAALITRMADCYETSGDVVRFHFRETMVLRREPYAEHAWRICHFHCSPLAPADEPRPGFNDSGATRGRRGETIAMTDAS